MSKPLSRRAFVKGSLLTTAVLPAALSLSTRAQTPAPSADPMPMGRIGNVDISRLILGGNLIGGYAHSRDLPYVSTLMRRYNTPAKIRETLELAEAQGINAINTWVMQENQALFDHWKNGGKMKWISQVRLDEKKGFAQVQKAADEGACAIHLTGDTCERLLEENGFDKVSESLEYIRKKGLVCGVAAHDLKVIVECERLKLTPDFYQKTFHTNDYFSAAKPGEGPVGQNDNSWCEDAQAVTKVMADVKRPWIAFKILAAGALQPRAAFPHAYNSGADFILVGMFDWQVEENAKFARRVFKIVRGPESKRTRPWYGDTTPALSKA